MATKTRVESPAGEFIEILTDDEWSELTGEPATAVRQFSGCKPWFLRALYEHGEFTNKSGFTTRELIGWINSTYPVAASTVKHKVISPTALSSMLNSPSNVPAIERAITGKRCYSIKLVGLPESWLRKLEKHIEEYPPPQPVEESPEPITDDDIETEITGVETEWNPATSEWETVESVSDMDIQELLDSVPGVDAPTIFETFPVMDLQIASQVAMSLLTTVVEIITAGSSASIDERVRKLQGDFSEVSQKLSQRLSENDSLRRQLRAAGDDIRALRHERDGLRARLRATEANLTAALKGDAVRAINGEIQKRVDSIMRAAPTNKGE